MTTHEEHDRRAEDNIRNDIATYGWSVCLFEADTATPSFGYTIGLWQSFSHPEIIAFGLPVKTLQAMLNTAAELVREGEALVLSIDNNEILNNLPVQFRQVEPSNITDYFGYGRWFYDYKPFPAVQLFWPDKASVFPWDANYDEQYEFDQPLLDRQLDFKFFEPRNVATFVAKQIFKEGQPILRVLHDEEDDSWQFLTGETVTKDDIMIVALEQVVKHDPTINELFNLPTGRVATREFVGAKWTREKQETEVDEEE